MHNKGLLP